MKRKTKKILVIIIVTIIIFIYFFTKTKKIHYSEDIIFFKLFSNSRQQKLNNEVQAYNFKFNSKTKKEISKQINLIDTISQENSYKNNIINKKIAPGTKGKFEIRLETNKDITYQVCFKDYGKKPQNLLYKIKGNNEKFESLKDLEPFLRGNLNGKECKNICVEWNWSYESSKENDIQDTKDGQIIKEYKFDINIIANEI